MSATPSLPNRRRAGFSLVEVALSLMVVSIGLIALFGVFASSLTASQKADHETQSVFFAKTVLNSIRAELNHDWHTTVFPLGADAAHQVEANLGTSRAVIFVADTVDTWMNYLLTIDTVSPDKHKRVTLEVWPGEVANTAEPGQVFYTEVYRMERP